MITIKASEYGKRRYVDCDCVCQNGIFLTPERCTDVCNLTCGYLIGDKEPHYPMPVIRLAVTIDYEFVAVWRVGVDCVYYQDDYETVWLGTVYYHQAQ